jgi:hypothetical protein
LGGEKADKGPAAPAAENPRLAWMSRPPIARVVIRAATGTVSGSSSNHEKPRHPGISEIFARRGHAPHSRSIHRNI